MIEKEVLKAKTIKGVKWSGISQLLVNIFDFTVYALLARILYPKDFGIFAMATVFTGLVAVINQLGLEIAIIQRKDIEEIHLSSTFWFILAFGVVLGLSVSGSAFILEKYFTNPLVKPILMVLSINFVINDLGFIHFSLLQRRLEFKKIALIETLTIIMGGGASVLMALKGFGVWSLVGGWIGQSFIRVVLSWLLCDWRPESIFSFQSVRDLFAFGRHIVGCRIASQISNNIIHLTIGRIYGEYYLGVYSFAYKLSHIPADKLSSIIARVALPVFSSVQEDNKTIRHIYRKKVLYLSLLCFPLLFGLLATTPRFIGIVYGSKWLDAVLPVRIFCFMGLVTCISTTAGIILRAKGRPDKELVWTVVWAITLVLSIFGSLQYSLKGVCVALTVSTIVLFSYLQYMGNRMISLKAKDFFSSLYPAVILSLAMLIVIVVYENLIGHFFKVMSVMGLFLPVSIGAAVYVGLIRWKYSDLFTEIKALVRH
ncbi:MAG: MOP flippase family protein [bacterium]